MTPEKEGELTPAMDSGVVASIDAKALNVWFASHIQPKIRADGGNVEIDGVFDGKIELRAEAECSTCPATEPCLVWWIGNEIERRFGVRMRVLMRRTPPYFR